MFPPLGRFLTVGSNLVNPLVHLPVCPSFPILLPLPPPPLHSAPFLSKSDSALPSHSWTFFLFSLPCRRWMTVYMEYQSYCHFVGIGSTHPSPTSDCVSRPPASGSMGGGGGGATLACGLGVHRLGGTKEVIKEQPSSRNLSATATRVLQCTCLVAASRKDRSAIVKLYC